MLILDVGVFGAVFLVTRFAIEDESLKIVAIGTIGAFLNVIMYGSPLAAVVRFSAYYFYFNLII